MTSPKKVNCPRISEAAEILERARKAAIEYYALTGKPLGITGELDENLAARLLGLTLAEARKAGFDARDEAGRSIQIKTRRVSSTKRRTGQVGSISLEHQWGCVLLILLDEQYQPHAIYEADRNVLKETLEKPGSIARKERGSLAVSKFTSIGGQVWPTELNVNEVYNPRISITPTTRP